MPSPGQSPPSAKLGRRSRNAKDAWTRPLWPLHLKPLPDELFSSWLVRLAHAHGLKVHTFNRLLFGTDAQFWNRDIDRLVPEWLLDAVCWNTATSKEDAWGASLRAYEGILYRQYRESSILQWILPLRIFHQTRRGFGLQFCPRCLADDREPYFRKRWRVAFYTYCAIHNTMLHDQCPKCASPVIFQRRDLGHAERGDGGNLALCHACNFDLREARVTEPVFYEDGAHQAFELAILRLEHRGPWCKPRSVRYYNVLHHLSRLLTAKYRRLALLQFVSRQVQAPEVVLSEGIRAFEMRMVHERHHLVQLAFWLLADLDARVSSAWWSGAVTYSALLRDFDDRPAWYDQVVGKFIRRGGMSLWR